MKKFLLIFVIIFLASCGQNNLSQNNPSTNKENIQAEKMENMSSEKIEEKEKNTSDYIELFQKKLGAELGKISEMDEKYRTKKVGNLKLTIERNGVIIEHTNSKYSSFHPVIIRYEDIIWDKSDDCCDGGFGQRLSEFLTKNNLELNDENFEKFFKEDVKGWIAEILDYPEYESKNGFETLSIWHYDYVSSYVFDESGIFVGQFDYLRDVVEKGGKIFVYYGWGDVPRYVSIFNVSYGYSIEEIKWANHKDFLEIKENDDVIEIKSKDGNIKFSLNNEEFMFQ